jgi:hypothetical protein
VDGCRILSRGSPSYLDGSEARLFEIVGAAHNLSSGSDELADQSSNWPERYHLSPARANFLRAMQLEPEMAVLDIGAGCGALTQYLGEKCRLVDALEPVLERARVARARTRNLTNVEVFVGSLADVPAETTYDLIVVAGVLEYVGHGSSDASHYRSLLADCASRLSQGGALLVAIENSLGVKYLVGAPEDHSGRPFDSLEGYPEGSPARTFARSTLTRWLIEVGLRPTFLSAFPDYKLTRTLLADRLFETQPDLAWRLAKFPSPDWPGPTHRVAREAAAWRTLVEAGLGSQTANSFVLLASDSSAQSIWPDDQIAAFYQNDRRAAFSVQTKVTDRDGHLHFSRQPAEREDGHGPQDRSSPTSTTLRLTLDAGKGDYVAGKEMIEVLAASTVAEAGRMMQLWVDLIDGILAAAHDGTPFDALPHNVVVTPAGELVLVDSKWEAAGLARADLMGRCALWTALHLSERANLSRWGDANGEGLALRIGEMVGLPGDVSWIAAAIAWEARLQDAVTIRGGSLPPGPARVQEIESMLWRRLKTSPEASVSAGSESFSQILSSLSAAGAKVALLEGSLSWRITKPLRAANAVRRSLIRRRVPHQH